LRISVRVVLGTLAMAWVAPAQQAAPAAETRAGLIEQQRRQKAAALSPDLPDRVERAIDYVQDHQVLDRLFQGYKGLRPRIGGLVTGSGFAAGPEYFRRDLLHDQAIFRASVRGSLRKFYVLDSEFSLPKLANGHLFLDFYAAHRDYPRIDYYGPGPDSAKSGRSGFLMEDTSFQANGGFSLARHLRVGGFGRYLMVNVGRGRDERFVSTDAIFTEATTPGIQTQTNFAHAGGFVQYDWRDNPGVPRSGGNYIAEYSTFTDLLRSRYSFDRVDLEVQQYFGFFHKRRVIALRGRVEATDARNGNVTPFYLQPTIGGSDDLRGFRPFRFYDNNSMVLNGEYRWELTTGIDMAIFTDAGRVFGRWRDIGFGDLEKDYGFGFRFHTREGVALRVDTGFSREGFQVWIKFNNVF